MQTVAIKKSLTAASTNCIAQAQTVSAAGTVTLNGGSVAAQAWGPFAASISIATLDTARRVAIISSGNDSTITATIQGWRDGTPSQPIQETLALTNGGTAVSVLDYMAVGTVTLSGAAAANITIGTNGTGSTQWFMPNFHLTPFELNDQTEVTGTVTWNLETTNDYGWWAPPPANNMSTPQPNVNEVVQGSTIAQNSTILAAVTGYRHTITAGTGTLSAQTLQSGLTNM